MSGSIAYKRVSKDLQHIVNFLKSHPTNGDGTSPAITSVIAEDGLFAWKIAVTPGCSSVYNVEGKCYELDVLFSEDYPHEPPTVRFITPVYSPVVTEKGQICEQLLARDWTPDQRAHEAIQRVIEKVFVEFAINRDNDVNPEARECLDKCPQEFEVKLRN